MTCMRKMIKIMIFIGQICSESLFCIFGCFLGINFCYCVARVFLTKVYSVSTFYSKLTGESGMKHSKVKQAKIY